MVHLMVNGDAMRGGRLHHHVAAHRFLGEVETAARYRLLAVRDEFPALLAEGPTGGGAVRGELYDVPLHALRDAFLPDEPGELELGVVELADGTAALSMVLREQERDRHTDITAFGGWRAYRDSRDRGGR